MLIKVLLIGGCIMVALFAYSCLVASSKADAQAEKYFRKIPEDTDFGAINNAELSNKNTKNRGER